MILHVPYPGGQEFHTCISVSYNQVSPIKDVTKSRQQISVPNPGFLYKGPEHKSRIIVQCSDEAFPDIQRFYRLRAILIRHLFTCFHSQCRNDLNNVKDTNSANFYVKLTAISKVFFCFLLKTSHNVYDYNS